MNNSINSETPRTDGTNGSDIEFIFDGFACRFNDSDDEFPTVREAIDNDMKEV